MKYISFDGVIVNFMEVLFDEWKNSPERFNMPWDNEVRYIKRKNFKKVLDESIVFNDIVNVVKSMDINDTVILTKVYSLENEATAKIDFLRNLGVKHNVLLVPYNLKYTDVVAACDNLLIDSSFDNLYDWHNNGGRFIYFDRKNFDSYNDYKKVLLKNKR